MLKIFANAVELSSMQAKGTKSTSFRTQVRNDVDLVPLACEDAELYHDTFPDDMHIVS